MLQTEALWFCHIFIGWKKSNSHFQLLVESCKLCQLWRCEHFNQAVMVRLLPYVKVDLSVVLRPWITKLYLSSTLSPHDQKDLKICKVESRQKIEPINSTMKSYEEDFQSSNPLMANISNLKFSFIQNMNMNSLKTMHIENVKIKGWVCYGKQVAILLQTGCHFWLTFLKITFCSTSNQNLKHEGL